MMKCDKCKNDFPPEILSMITKGGKEGLTYTKPLCGICGLKFTNNLHGTKRKTFKGEQAEYQRLEAVRILKERGDAK